MIFISGFFRGQDKSPSFARCAGGFVLIVWAILTLWTRHVPDHSAEIFSGIVALYTANSIRNAVQSFGKEKPKENEATQ